MKQRIQMTWILAIVFGVILVFVLPVYAAPSVFDWDVSTNAWPAGNPLSASYSGVGTPPTNFNFVFTDAADRFENGSPATNTIITGGTAGQNTLFIAANYATTSESIILTIDLSSYATGVSFTLMDIDWSITGGNKLQDEVVVTGFHVINNSSVIPSLTATNASNVIVVNNVATSSSTEAPVDNTTNGGNVFVNFGSTPINRIVITYRPGPLSTNDPPVIGGPDGGGIALHDISFTPSTPTAVSLQSFQAQTPDIVAPLMLASTMIAGFTVVWAVQRRRQLKKVVKPAPIRPTHTP